MAVAIFIRSPRQGGKNFRKIFFVFSTHNRPSKTPFAACSNTKFNSAGKTGLRPCRKNEVEHVQERSREAVQVCNADDGKKCLWLKKNGVLSEHERNGFSQVHLLAIILCKTI